MSVNPKLDAMKKHNCDNIVCNHNNTKGSCCLYNPDNCKYRQLQKENAELKSIADFQTSSNMDRYFQLKRSKEQLTRAKELLKRWLRLYNTNTLKGIIADTEQFISEVEK